MKIKVLLFVLALITLSACGQNNSEKTLGTTEKRLEGFLINNLPLNESDATFPISELKEFFEVPSSHSSIFNVNRLTLDEINKRFPIKHLRKVENSECYYLAYPVSEGGKYLVFLGAVIDTASGNKKACAYRSIYVYNLPNETNFSSLNSGDTYSEVATIAPYTYMPIISSGKISYSLLADGSVMQCSYVGEELVLENMELLTPEDSLYPFVGMLLSDLVE